MKNILDLHNRSEFREWLSEYSATERECWLAVKRGKTPPADPLWYLDAEFVIDQEIRVRSSKM